MRKLLFLLAVPFLLSSCNAQQTENQDKAEKETISIEPKVDVKVNKQYDDNGNLIAYDSTYVWSYSNTWGDSVDVNIDSVLSEFKSMAGINYPYFFNDHYDEYFNDSLFYQDFLMPDYFLNRWQQQMFQMDRMMREMDSMKQSFFREEYPGLEKKSGISD